MIFCIEREMLTRTFIWLFIIQILSGLNSSAQGIIPIQFPEYNISVEASFKLGDTVLQRYSHDEFFKFVFSDFRGKCYCERYKNKKLYEKGCYVNSLDTLKKYASGGYIHGRSSKIFVLKFFEPLKNGTWITYKNGIAESKTYIMGIVADKLVPD